MATDNACPPSPPNPSDLTDHELLIQLFLRMNWLVERVEAMNHRGSRAEHLAYAALGASGVALVLAGTSLIAWIVVATR